MTGPLTPQPTVPRLSARWFARPPVMIGGAAVLLVLVALFAPDMTNGRSGDARLTTYSTAPQGAQMFYELAGRLGWSVSRRTTPDPAVDSTAVQAVLAPAEPLRMVEVHTLLETVRRGGALLLVLPGGAGAINDSLHVALGSGASFAPPDSLGTASCPKQTNAILPLWPADQVLLYSLRWTAPPPAPAGP